MKKLLAVLCLTMFGCHHMHYSIEGKQDGGVRSYTISADDGDLLYLRRKVMEMGKKLCAGWGQDFRIPYGTEIQRKDYASLTMTFVCVEK